MRTIPTVIYRTNHEIFARGFNSQLVAKTGLCLVGVNNLELIHTEGFAMGEEHAKAAFAKRMSALPRSAIS